MAMPAYDFDAFSPAKKRQEQQIKKPNLKKVKPIQKTEEELREEKRRVRVKCLRFTFCIVLAASLGFLNIFAYYQNDSADRQINELNEKINMIEGENAEYSMKLSNMISLEQIETVAVEKLGLVKVNQNDIEYVKLATENRVLYSAGKITD